MTMWSANSVPRITSLLKPPPPSTETGAFMLYSTWFWPEPVRMSVWPAVENPLVSRGIAIIAWALIQMIWHSWVGSIWPLASVAQAAPVVVPSTLVWASAKALTTNRSLPSSPSRRSGAWFE